MGRRACSRLPPFPEHEGSFRRNVGVFREGDADIVFVLDAPPGAGEGSIYVSVPPEVACAIRSDLTNMLNCVYDGTPQPVVPLNEERWFFYAPGDVTREHDGGIRLSLADPGGDLLVRLGRREASDLLH